MRRRFPVLPLIVCLMAGLAVMSTIQANDQTKAENPQPADKMTESPVSQTSAYFGIGVEPLSTALVSQLSGKLKDGQGVLVSQVIEGSPAAKAGLKAFDIVTRYDNQKVLSPEQFVKLVRHDQPGRVAKLQILRAGTPKEVEFTLGEQPAKAEMQKHPSARKQMGHFFVRRPLQKESEFQWTSFDSLNLARVDDHHFKAEIAYKNDKGEMETRQYEGTLDEIRADVEQCKDLPKYEQAHLLRAIESPNHTFLDFPFIEMMPEVGIIWDEE